MISHEDAVSKNTEDVDDRSDERRQIPMNIRPQNAYSIELFSGLESIKENVK